MLWGSHVTTDNHQPLRRAPGRQFYLPLRVVHDARIIVRAQQRCFRVAQWRMTSLVDDIIARSPAIIYVAAPDAMHTVRYASQRLKQLLGYTPEQLRGRPWLWWRQIVAEDRVHSRELLAASRRAGTPFTTVYRFRTRDGRLLWLHQEALPTFDDAGNIVAYNGVLVDVTSWKSAETDMMRLAFTDPLTGLANRRRMTDLGSSAASSEGSSTSLLYLDLDRFKTVNDTLGHDAGDELLVQVAARLRTCVRDADTLARMGGDEFAVLLPRTDAAQALVVAGRMLEYIAQPFELRGQTVHLGGSIGIAVAPSATLAFHALLTQADIAMYRAKVAGGGVQVYDPVASPWLSERLSLEAELRQALSSNGLTLHYQPILDLPLDRVIGLEALVRWQHPSRGLLGPDVFLPLAEEVGLIKALDRWVLHAALRQAAAWFAVGRQLDVAINLTVHSVQDTNFVTLLNELLTLTGAPAERIIIEVTERSALRDLAATREVFVGLRSRGLRIALDDFGSGYGSLAYLQQLPIDMLKIDRVFTAGIGRSLRDEAVVRSLLELGQGLGLRIVVEGVEEEAQLAWLRSSGGNLVQGYLIGRPAPADLITIDQRPRPQSGSATVLVVDDTVDNRIIMQRMLKAQGYTVLSASDGEEALIQAERSRPDLVLMDLAMPRMDGWQATRQLRARPHLAHIPVIAITGHVTGEDLDRAFEAGCVDYLPKPFTYDALIRMVRFHLSLTKE